MALPPDPTLLADLMDRGYRYALALTGQPEAAADALQDAWVALLRADGDFTPGYLFNAIRSRVIDQARRPRFQVVTAPEALPEPPADEPEPLDLPVSIERLPAALARLREDEREALFLTAIEGWTVEAVAAHQQRPRGTLLSLLHRARSKLHRWLTAHDDHEAHHG